MLFDELVKSVLEDDMKDSIADLLAKKVKMSESDKAPKIEKINAYIEKNIEYYKTLADSMEDDRKPEWDPLEACFRKIL